MGGVKKEYQPLGPSYRDHEGKPLTVLGAVLQTFSASPRIGPIVIVIPPHGEDAEAAAKQSLPAALLAALLKEGRLHFVPGGDTRRASVHRALAFLEKSGCPYVLIHDGARPWVSPALIERTIDAVIQYKAVIPALPMVETPKELETETGKKAPDGPVFIKRHLRRPAIVTAQTPQAFAFPAILKAHEKASDRETRGSFEYTDDAEVWAEFEGPVAAIPGEKENKKITYQGILANFYEATLPVLILHLPLFDTPGHPVLTTQGHPNQAEAERFFLLVYII
jgi:2-C-methyl-D-erythritol 4-phosphate cytidylyltransferase/2-C-methyl-D-erythritol 4-phosphate cytidylyltransferase/2-C-methyl-D-erythritol 2,4-cyclodiphosphate synthase